MTTSTIDRNEDSSSLYFFISDAIIILFPLFDFIFEPNDAALIRPAMSNQNKLHAA